MKTYCKIIIFVTLIGFVGCKKDILTSVQGKYNFTIQVSNNYRPYPTSTGQDTAFYFTGSITSNNGNSLKITYSIPIEPNSNIHLFSVLGTIYPEINNDGTITYPDFTNVLHNSFKGNFKNNEIYFTIGYEMANLLTTETIHGTKY